MISGFVESFFGRWWIKSHLTRIVLNRLRRVEDYRVIFYKRSAHRSRRVGGWWWVKLARRDERIARLVGGRRSELVHRVVYANKSEGGWFTFNKLYSRLLKHSHFPCKNPRCLIRANSTLISFKFPSISSLDTSLIGRVDSSHSVTIVSLSFSGGLAPSGAADESLLLCNWVRNRKVNPPAVSSCHDC